MYSGVALIIGMVMYGETIPGGIFILWVIGVIMDEIFKKEK